MGELTLGRLALLARLLDTLAAQGWTRVTSRELARWVGTTPDTIRKDLAGTGRGTAGAAYEVDELRERLQRLAPRSGARKTALAGLGDLGVALAAGPGVVFPWSFAVGFDGRPNRLETVDLPFPLYPTTEIVQVCLRLGIEVAVLAVSPNEAQKVAERFVQAGVRRLVNYSPVVLRVDRNRIAVEEFGGGW
jgi:redox-sensing transcriptional repressor